MSNPSFRTWRGRLALWGGLVLGLSQVGCAHPVMVEPHVVLSPRMGHPPVYGPVYERGHAHGYAQVPASRPVYVLPSPPPRVVYQPAPPARVVYQRPVWVAPAHVAPAHASPAHVGPVRPGPVHRPTLQSIRAERAEPSGKGGARDGRDGRERNDARDGRDGRDGYGGERGPSRGGDRDAWRR